MVGDGTKHTNFHLQFDRLPQLIDYSLVVAYGYEHREHRHASIGELEVLDGGLLADELLRHGLEFTSLHTHGLGVERLSVAEVHHINEVHEAALAFLVPQRSRTPHLGRP